MDIVTVSAAVLVNVKNEVLLTQRPEGKSMAGLWEFPGGKIEVGETPESALVRELKEELEISVKTEDLTPLTFASHSYNSFHLLMPVFVCRSWSGSITPQESQAIAWVAVRRLSDYCMPPADAPLIPILNKLL